MRFCASMPYASTMVCPKIVAGIGADHVQEVLVALQESAAWTMCAPPKAGRYVTVNLATPETSSVTVPVILLKQAPRLRTASLATT